MHKIDSLISHLAFKDQWLSAERHRLVNARLDLLEDCLSGYIYEDPPLKANGGEAYDANLREYGWDWPSVAHTMIGRKRLKNLRLLVENVIGAGVPGDLIETGVWRGGACIMMKGVLDAWNDTGRTVWVADSFEGLPKPDIDKYPADTGDTFYTFDELNVSIDQVKRNFQKYGLLDSRVQFLKGWFKDTLADAPIERLALLRLDGDMYESTMDALVALYDKVSENGYIIIDDYHVVEGCKKAVHDFLTGRGIVAEFQEIDRVGIYWKKSGSVESGAQVTEIQTEAPADAVLPPDLFKSLLAEIVDERNDLKSAIEKFTSKLEAEENRAKCLQSDLQIESQKLDDARAECLALQSALESSQAVVDKLQCELQVQTGALDESIIANSALHKMLMATQLDCTQLRNALNDMTNSTSWKLTKPLRHIKSKFL